LLITRGAGAGLDAHCFLSNMSSGPVHVASVLVKLETPAGSLICPVTDMLHPGGGSGRSSAAHAARPFRERRDQGSGFLRYPDAPRAACQIGNPACRRMAH
jgi:hypothetical protein